MLDATPIALFVLLPIFALLLKVFYWRKGRYAYHLVFTFYFFAFLFIVSNFSSNFRFYNRCSRLDRFFNNSIYIYLSLHCFKTFLWTRLVFEFNKKRNNNVCISIYGFAYSFNCTRNDIFYVLLKLNFKK